MEEMGRNEGRKRDFGREASCVSLLLSPPLEEKVEGEIEAVKEEDGRRYRIMIDVLMD